MRRIVPLLLAFASMPAAAVAGTSFTKSGDGLGVVLFDASGTDTMTIGSSADFDRAQAYRSGHAPMLYVRDGGHAYVIRDAALLQRANAIVEPQRKLGERQGELGKQQGALGHRQGALGAEQARLGAQMANTPLKRIGEIGRQQGDLGRRQAELGAQQAALGERQAELGRQQADLAEQAKPQFRALVADAVRRGLAQRVD
jgi:hypothetical protein